MRDSHSLHILRDIPPYDVKVPSSGRRIGITLSASLNVGELLEVAARSDDMASIDHFMGVMVVMSITLVSKSSYLAFKEGPYPPSTISIKPSGMLLANLICSPNQQTPLPHGRIQTSFGSRIWLTAMTISAPCSRSSGTNLFAATAALV